MIKNILIYFLIFKIYQSNNELIPPPDDLVFPEKDKCKKFTAKEWIYIKKTWNNYKVIYTAITNDYDVNQIPYFLNYDFDYIFFTDNYKYYLQDDLSIWQIYPIPEDILKLNINLIKQTKCIKINPHRYLHPYYNLSIYIDGAIVIINDVNLLLKELNKQYGNSNMYIPIHRHRKCLYDEAKTVLIMKKDIKQNINPQINRYKWEGFPKNYGLSENNIIIRNHFNENIIQLMKDWWKEVYWGSYRDQLSYKYAAWLNNKTKVIYFNRDLFNKYFFWYDKHPNFKNNHEFINKEYSNKIIKKLLILI